MITNTVSINKAPITCHTCITTRSVYVTSGVLRPRCTNFNIPQKACAGPRQFLWVSPLPAYSPGGMLNAFAWPLTCSDQQRASIVYRADVSFTKADPAIYVEKWEGQLAIEIKDTHPVDSKKIRNTFKRRQHREVKTHWKGYSQSWEEKKEIDRYVSRW